MPPGRSIFWERSIGGTSSCRSDDTAFGAIRLIVAVVLATGGCSTVNRPVQSSTKATSSMAPAAATFRAQSGDPRRGRADHPPTPTGLRTTLDTKRTLACIFGL